MMEKSMLIKAYALPPLSTLRCRPPQSFPPWANTLKTSTYGNVYSQDGLTQKNSVEDCYLDALPRK